METFSALLAICAGNSPVTGEFSAQRPVTRSFDVVFFYLRLNKWLSKQSWGWWFETPSRPVWRQCNDVCVTKTLIACIPVIRANGYLPNIKEIRHCLISLIFDRHPIAWITDTQSPQNDNWIYNIGIPYKIRTWFCCVLFSCSYIMGCWWIGVVYLPIFCRVAPLAPVNRK